MDSERLARYLAGEASTAERAEVDAWKAADPANRAELSRLEAVWGAAPAAGSWDVDRAWKAVSYRLDRDPSAEVDVIPLRRPAWTGWLAAAAVLIVAVGGFWLSRPAAPTTFATGVGERRTVTLPDGSEVTLAPASQLTIAPNYARPNREITLTGRAWFVVDHDADRPFRITTPGGVVEDLGTEFEVMATGARLQVAVASGTVAIHRTGAPSVTLTAGDLVSVGSAGEPTVSHQIAVDRITSWRAGTLDFDDRPLTEVAAELERWYDISFALGDGAGDRRFSGPIPTDRLDQAIAIVSTAFPEMAVARDGRTISIAPKRSP